MSDVTGSYGTLLNFIAFFFLGFLRTFMSEVLYFRKTLTGYVSNQYTHFDV